MTARIAIYYAPHPRHPLAERASYWLGRDASAREASPTTPPGDFTQVLSPSRWLSLTESARHYGFHATLKPPFRIAAQSETKASKALNRLDSRLRDFGNTRAPLSVRLRVDEIDDFIALVPARPQREIGELASEVVREFDDFRQVADEAELDRRRAAGLTARQEAHLRTWGYPYVHDQFRFHMTLTQRISDASERGELRSALAALFVDVLEQPISIDATVVFEQSKRDDPFYWRARYPFSQPDSITRATTS